MDTINQNTCVFKSIRFHVDMVSIISSGGFSPSIIGHVESLLILISPKLYIYLPFAKHTSVCSGLTYMGVRFPTWLGQLSLCWFKITRRSVVFLYVLNHVVGNP